jgi:glycosyltransferase involved in cell wall biosynthesis
MHVMFIHPNFPAQFGHVAQRLARRPGWECTVLTSVDTSHLELPFTHVNYRVKDGPLPKVFESPSDLMGLLDHLHAVYRGLRSAPGIRPDLVVGHMSYGTMLYLRNLYAGPFVGYFDMLPPPFWSEALALRPEFPPPEVTRLFNATFHTLTHLHLQACDAFYTATEWQRGTAPPEKRAAMRVIHDGIDCEFFRPRRIARPLRFQGVEIAPGSRVVSFAARGLESVRGFDVFMKAARLVADEVPEALFLIAGAERTYYGHDESHTGGLSFKRWVMAQGDYDPARFHFLGRVPPRELATLFNLSDLHVYLTVPYVLSWSLLMAMASGCLVLGSATAPVQEVIDDGLHGLLAPFGDVEALAGRAVRALRRPEEHAALRAAARARVLERYEVGACVERLARFYEEVRG